MSRCQLSKNCRCLKLSALQRTEIEAAVNVYLRAVEGGKWKDANASLLQIDALVLKGYDLPPRLELIITGLL